MTSKIKCIAIDDEPVALDIIRDYVNKIPFLDLLGTYRNALQALEFLQNVKVDLIFLDINMPDINGIQFFKSLKFKPKIIFTTAYPEFAVESYELDAIDYLLKPIEFERFLKAANKVTDQQALEAHAISNTNANDFIVLKSGTKAYKIDYSDIMFIEGSGNYLTFHTSLSKIMVLMSMNEALQILPESMFVRVHKSFIISLNYVSVIENHQVQIKDRKIPVGSYYRGSFLLKMKGLSR
jgi:two-component system, LytTR family, response regulator